MGSSMERWLLASSSTAGGSCPEGTDLRLPEAFPSAAATAGATGMGWILLLTIHAAMSLPSAPLLLARPAERVSKSAPAAETS